MSCMSVWLEGPQGPTTMQKKWLAQGVYPMHFFSWVCKEMRNLICWRGFAYWFLFSESGEGKVGGGGEVQGSLGEGAGEGADGGKATNCIFTKNVKFQWPCRSKQKHQYSRIKTRANPYDESTNKFASIQQNTQTRQRQRKQNRALKCTIHSDFPWCC